MKSQPSRPRGVDIVEGSSVSAFFVEFEVADDERFRQLAAVFDALRAAKWADEWRDDGYWLGFFDAKAKAHFWWPTPAEREEWGRRWASTSVSRRSTDPSLQNPWDFGSMIDAFRHGDYDLLGCERVSERVGRLSFDPLGWPCGGTGCLRALAEAFGHRVVAEPLSMQTAARRHSRRAGDVSPRSLNSLTCWSV